MSELTERLRRLYVQNGTNYVQQAADEIEKLTRELANAQVAGIHSCHADCTRSGCVNSRLRDALARVEVIMWHHSSEFPELREVVRAALRGST